MLENLEGRDHLRERDVDDKITLRYNLEKTFCKSVDWIYLGPMTACCEYSNKPWNSVEDGSIFTYLPTVSFSMALVMRCQPSYRIGWSLYKQNLTPLAYCFVYP